MIDESTNWYTLIIDNWAQILLVITGIGYIIKTIADWKIKRYEISFNKIQENKIIEIKEFYKSYQALEIALDDFLSEAESGLHSEQKFNEHRVVVRNCNIDFKYKCMTVKLFAEKNDINTIDEISKVCGEIRFGIERWLIYKGSDNPPSNLDSLNDITRKFPILPELIKKIENNFRKSYFL